MGGEELDVATVAAYRGCGVVPSLKHNPLSWVFLLAAGVRRPELIFFVSCVCALSLASACCDWHFTDATVH